MPRLIRFQAWTAPVDRDQKGTHRTMVFDMDRPFDSPMVCDETKPFDYWGKGRRLAPSSGPAPAALGITGQPPESAGMDFVRAKLAIIPATLWTPLDPAELSFPLEAIYQRLAHRLDGLPPYRIRVDTASFGSPRRVVIEVPDFYLSGSFSEEDVRARIIDYLVNSTAPMHWEQWIRIAPRRSDDAPQSIPIPTARPADDPRPTT